MIDHQPASPARRFPESEFASRLARLHSEMRRRSLDAMLLDDIEIVAYFTGFEISLNAYRACVVPLAGAPIMVLRRLDVAPFRERVPFAECVGFSDTDDPAAAVGAVLRQRGFAKASIGADFGSHAMTVATYHALRSGLPDARFVDVRHLGWELRLVKSDAELELMKAAARIADAVMAATIADLRTGMSARSVAATAAEHVVRRGGDPEIVARVAVGRGWDFLHDLDVDRQVGAGDALHIELAPSYGGYSARLMRSVVIGDVDDDRRRVAERLIAVQDAQISAMRSGADAAAVDRIVRQGVLEAGLRDSYDNITGYTLGYYSRQPVRSSDFTRTFCPTARWSLVRDMVFHMYTSAQGISVSETVRVGDDGGHRLTSLDRRLFSVPVI